MLRKSQTSRVALWKYLVILPLFFSAFFIVSCSDNAGKEEIPDNVLSDEKLDGEPVFRVVDEFPAFPGGEKARMEYLQNNITYPEELQSDSIQGTVYIKFTIDKNGVVHNPEVLRGVHETLDAEALEAIENMPDWEPGYYNGEPVNVNFNMPIRFALN